MAPPRARAKCLTQPSQHRQVGRKLHPLKPRGRGDTYLAMLHPACGLITWRAAELVPADVLT